MTKTITGNGSSASRPAEGPVANNARRDFLGRVGVLTGAAGALASGVLGAGIPLSQARAHSVAWEQPGNNNKVLKLQESFSASGSVSLDFYGHCAFKLTSPGGVILMFDPWRNDPSGAWGLWFLKEFPKTLVDIGLSTHTHFDHDALERVDATIVLDRMIGSYEFADVKITGLADKHACQAPGWYSWTNAIKEFGASPCPPDNPGHMDMAMYIVETGGLRILMWGDNRHNPSDYVKQKLIAADIDVLTIPVDGSQHILSYEQGDEIVAWLKPRMVIPTHYLCEGVSLTLTTLQSSDEWVARQKNKTNLSSPSMELNVAEIKKMKQEFHYFGNNAIKPS